MGSVKYALWIVVLIVFVYACKSNKPVAKHSKNYRPTTVVLSDKPLDTMKKYVEGIRWKMLNSIGGITGSDKNNFEDLYYTFLGNGTMISEKNGDTSRQKYSWKQKTDIHTGDSTYVLFTGLAGWIVDGIYKDTLRMADNHPDGYSYTFVKANND